MRVSFFLAVRPRFAPAVAIGLLLTACGGANEQPGVPAPTRPAPLGQAPRGGRLAPELEAAARAIEERRFEEARVVAERYLADHPADGQAPFLIGLSHYWADNHGAARPWFERARDQAPELVAVHELLGASLFRLGELDESRRAYEAYLAAAPTDPKGSYGLGLIDLDESELDAAARRFRDALAQFDAIEQADPRQAVARRAERAECHARLGEVHFARGELVEARRELLRATELAAENLSAFYTLSLVHRRLGEERLADEAAERYESERAKRVVRPGERPR